MFKAIWFVLAVGWSGASGRCAGQTRPASDANTNGATLRMDVLSASFEENPGSPAAVLRARLKLTFVNTGNKPLIILKGRPTVCPGAALTKAAGSLVREDILFDQYYGLSYNTLPEWRTLRAALDQPGPPSEITQSINPGDSWGTTGDVVMRPPKKLGTYLVNREPVSLELLRKASPLWMWVTCDMWPLNVEGWDPKLRIRFGRKLQKRWRRFGLLLLAPIVSQPAEVEFWGH